MSGPPKIGDEFTSLLQSFNSNEKSFYISAVFLLLTLNLNTDKSLFQSIKSEPVAVSVKVKVEGSKTHHESDPLHADKPVSHIVIENSHLSLGEKTCSNVNCLSAAELAFTSTTHVSSSK